MTAARIGEVFGMDPIVVLNSTSEEWFIRVAAVKVIAEDRRRASQEGEDD